MLASAAFAVLGCSRESATTAPSFPERDSLTVRAANAQIGTRSWQSSIFADQKDLAVWAAPYSANRGDTLDVHVHARYGPVAMTLYRMGWYGGTGAQQVWREAGITASVQPACSNPFPGPVVCAWTTTTRLPLSKSLLSGVYLLQVNDTTGKAAFFPFVIRSLTRSRFVAIVPQLTWQAYNNFGGSSLYTKGPDSLLGHVVSFERPYALRGGATYMYGPGYSNDASVLLWLEREGYDVTYASDADVPNLGWTNPAPEKALLFIGHDEYWTMEEFQTARRMRDAHVHLAFFAGNAAYWRVRLSQDSVTGLPNAIVACYKDTADPVALLNPSIRTTTFRNLGMPENALVGTGYMQHTYGGPYPLVVSDSDLGPEGRHFLAAASLEAGDTLPAIFSSLVSDWPTPASLEGNQVLQNGASPGELQVLFRGPYTGGVRARNGVFEATFYVAPSGAGVFSSGLNEWGRHLSGFFVPEIPAIAAVSHSILDWMDSQ